MSPDRLPTTYNVRDLSPDKLEELASAYARDGFVLLESVEPVTQALQNLVRETAEISLSDWQALLDPNQSAGLLPRECRQRLSKVTTTPSLTETILSQLGTVLERLLGPLVHVSSTFHTQVKGGPTDVAPVDHGGYPEQTDFMELHGQYLLHQDFTGANIPTTPSGLTLWVGLNGCQDWTLRLVRGSHRLGMLVDRWLRLDDERLQSLGEPVDVPAQPGRAIVFSSMLVHGTSNPGPMRRVSCDIRFFPLCGYLPTQPHFLSPDPLQSLRSCPDQDPVLLAPRREALAWLGQWRDDEPMEPLAPLQWPRFLQASLQGNARRARQHFDALVHPELASGSADAFAKRFYGRSPERSALHQTWARLGLDLSAQQPSP
jgi:hypothetical protein